MLQPQLRNTFNLCLSRKFPYLGNIPYIDSSETASNTSSRLVQRQLMVVDLKDLGRIGYKGGYTRSGIFLAPGVTWANSTQAMYTKFTWRVTSSTVNPTQHCGVRDTPALGVTKMDTINADTTPENHDYLRPDFWRWHSYTTTHYCHSMHRSLHPLLFGNCTDLVSWVGQPRSASITATKQQLTNLLTQWPVEQFRNITRRSHLENTPQVGTFKATKHPITKYATVIKIHCISLISTINAQIKFDANLAFPKSKSSRQENQRRQYKSKTRWQKKSLFSFSLLPSINSTPQWTPQSCPPLSQQKA